MASVWFVFIIFVIITILLLSGRGAFLISGYNTLSKEEKAKYDEKKICHVIGAGMLVITIMLFVQALLGENIPKWFITSFVLVTLVDIVVMIYLANRKCFVTETNQTFRKGSNAITKGTACLATILFLGVGFLLVTGNIEMQYHDTSFTIQADYWTDREIAYSDIEKIVFSVDGVDGSRVGGFGSFRLQMGSFQNREFGNYTRYTYANCDECIILTVKGKIVVIGGKDKESTQAIYKELIERCENKIVYKRRR